MNGIEATRNIRALGITIPVVAVTGNALDDDVKAFLSSGAQRILTKPVQRAVLQTTLKEYLPRFVLAPSAAQAAAKSSATKKARQ
jgi:CheY-like chemotaxis protein